MQGQHHLHLRKRASGKAPSPYPHPKALVRAFDRLMLIVAVAGPLALVPQVVQTLETKDVSGLSFLTWMLWTLLSVVWVAYGLLHKERPIVISQSLYLVLHAVILGAIFVHG